MTDDIYYRQHADELARMGVSAEDWAALESREEKIRGLIAQGLSHRRAVEIVHGVDLSRHAGWQDAGE